MLLDVHMPELDGFQVVRAVRERELAAGGHLPVIALTARSRKEDRERCLAAGMDEFLTKPIRAADLWAAIDRVAAARPPADRVLLDPRVLLAACGEDAVILEKICGALRAGLPDHVAAVEDALDRRRRTAAARGRSQDVWDRGRVFRRRPAAWRQKSRITRPMASSRRRGRWCRSSRRCLESSYGRWLPIDRGPATPSGGRRRLKRGEPRLSPPRRPGWMC